MANQNNDIENFISWVAEQMQVDFEQAQQKLEELNDEELLQLTEAYKKAMQTPMKKSGGKIEYFVAKYKDGGVNASIEKDSKKAKKAAERNASKAPNRGKATNRTEGGAVDQQGGQHFYMGEVVGGNSADTMIDIPQPGDTLVTQNIATRNGMISHQYLPGSPEYYSVMKRARVSPYLNGVLSALRKSLGY